MAPAPAHTDWMNGFYPYHEMNTYLGLIAIVLAVVGARGTPAQDRWVTFWILLLGLALVLMLGKFTFLFDYAHRIPIAGSSREPVRFHLWAALAVAALAAVGIERLSKSRGGIASRSRTGLGRLDDRARRSRSSGLVYAPVWKQLNSSIRSAESLAIPAGSAESFFSPSRARRSWRHWRGSWPGGRLGRQTPVARRAGLAALPLLIIADLLGSPGMMCRRSTRATGASLLNPSFGSGPIRA